MFQPEERNASKEALRQRLKFSATDEGGVPRFRSIWIDGLQNGQVNGELGEYVADRHLDDIDTAQVRLIIAREPGMDADQMAQLIDEYCQLMGRGQ